MNVFVYYWKSEEIQEPKNYYTQLRIYGISEEEKNVCITVEKCSTTSTIEILDLEYFKQNQDNILFKIKSLLWNTIEKQSVRIIYKRKLYGAHLNNDNTFKTFPYIKITFRSRIGMLSFRKRLLNEKLFPDFKFHEMGVSPEVKFIVENNLDSCGWIKIKNFYKKFDTLSRCDINICCSPEDLCRLDINKSVPIKLMAWDIECRCNDLTNGGTDFNDRIYQISCVFSHKNIMQKYLLTLGPCNKFDSDTIIQIFEDEKKLILGFTKLVKEQQPHVITGWNIFNFDTKFIINRAKMSCCVDEFTNFGFRNVGGNVVNLKWSSKAFNSTDVFYVDVEGIISIDLIEVVRKEYKLDSYSLNNVSKHFLKNQQKDDISFADLLKAFKSYETNSKDIAEEFSKIGKYCVQDSKLVIDLFQKLQTWLSLTEMSKTTSTPIMVVHLNGQQKKFYNQVYRYCYNNNILVETDAYKSKANDKYTGAYVFDPAPGLYEYVVPLDFASLYPSIMIAYNLDYTTMVFDNNTDNIPEQNLTIMEWEDHIGCKHDNLVVEKNTLTELIEKNNENKKKFIKQRAALTKKINKNVVCQQNSFKFLKQEIYGKGVLPSIIENLLFARKKIRSEMKTIKDPDQLAILDKKQLSYKIAANSMYGATGVKVGSLPFMPIAMCVTHTGRTSIKKAANIITSLGGQIVYGDTDSNYVKFPILENQTLDHVERCSMIWNFAIKAAEEISSHYPKPMKIEFEEVIYNQFLILTKKRYMYYSCDKFGNISNKIGQKGVLLARRDNSMIVKNTYETTVKKIFQNIDKNTLISDIINIFLEAKYRKLNYNVYKMTGSVNDYDNCNITIENENKWKMGSYIVPVATDDIKDKTTFCKARLPAPVQLEIKMLNRGEDKIEGSRIEYVVLDKIGFKKQCDKIENFDYFISNSRYFKIDIDYYINHTIEPLEQIFESVFKTENFVNKSLSVFKNKTKVVNEIKKIFKPKIIII